MLMPIVIVDVLLVTKKLG